MLPIIITFASILQLGFSVAPNVCKNSIDYFYMDDNPNCWYNPDVNATLEDMITSKGYPLESYQITSKDGYITDLYRISRAGENKGVVYLLHPATVTAKVWIDKGVNGSLAFMLYDAGFDVWLGNSRGSDLGNKHVRLTTDDPAYWDFTYHEMAVYDLPKNLEFIKNKTGGKKIAFAGHSMGGTVAYIYAAVLPEHAKEHLNVIVLLSAGGFFKNVKVLLLDTLSQMVNFAYDLLRSLNYVVIASKYDRDMVTRMVLDLCRTPLGLNMCPSILQLTLGITQAYYDPEMLKAVSYLKIASKEDFFMRIALSFCKTSFGYNSCPALSRFALGVTDTTLDPAYIPILFTQYPGGVPLKAYVHYGQWLSSPNMMYRMFDYGKYKNKKIYKSNLPPKYPIHTIKTPLYLIYGRNDWLSTPEGTEEFYNMLSEEAKIYGKKMLDEYNHGDMLVAMTVADDVYKPLIQFFEMVFSNQTIN